MPRPRSLPLLLLSVCVAACASAAPDDAACATASTSLAAVDAIPGGSFAVVRVVVAGST